MTSLRLGLVFPRNRLPFENRGVALAVQGADEQAILAVLNEVAAESLPGRAELAELVVNRKAEEDDWVLSDDLLCHEHASRSLDTSGAMRAARVILRAQGEQT